MTGRKDENGNWTYFDRDANNRVWRIRHPDGSTEEFTYNNYAQVLTHKLRTGGTETFEYDNQLPPTIHGLKTKQTDAMGNPTTYQYYSSGPNTDRVWKVTDPRNNTTTFEYNQRGQVTKVTHQDTTYTQSGYNDDGTLAWTADENHPGAATDINQRTRYTYDEYKRVLTVTNPMGQTAANDYGLDWASPLRHTTNNPKFTVSPLSRVVIYDYDANFRKVDQVVALQTPDEAWTFFQYDEVGNLNWMRDPRWNVTTFGYDQRNRKIWMDDAIASDRNGSGHTMNWLYDGVGNKLKETRADNAFRSWEYDVPNRITRAIDWRMNLSETAVTTTSSRNVTSTVETTTDAKGAVYTFEFDALHRKIKETYPLDSSQVHRTETWHYDTAGNMDSYKSPLDGNVFKTFVYDNRNRAIESYWSNYGSRLVTAYDAASRVSSITTNSGETTVAFGYDDANRKLWEDQTVAGYPTRHVLTQRDQDGNRANLLVTSPAGLHYGIYYDYTQRNQLSRIKDYPGTTPFFSYTYDPAGNVTKRTNVYNGVNDSMNLPSQYYDGLNRPTMCENTQAGDLPFARSWYQFDGAGREVATWRDEQSGKGERFWYSPTNQLTNVRYNADYVSTGSPAHETRAVDYVYETNMMNRSWMRDNGQITSYTVNWMNQYVGLNWVESLYDQNFNLYTLNGWRYDYDADKQLLLTTNGANTGQFVYDGLGRCVKRTINGVTTVITYDDWKPIMEWDVSGNLSAVNVYGPGADEILYRWVAATNSRYRYHHDIHGNVTFLLDWNGNQIVEKYAYDAFGKPEVRDAAGNLVEYPDHTPRSAVGNRFMFQGREYLQELGIYDYRHRYYHPGLGRFIQTDPTGFDAGDMNLFRYCGDDPVDRSDPMGLEYQVIGDPSDSNHFIIQVPIVWKGGNVQARQEMIRGIENRWSGKFGDVRVETHVTDGAKVSPNQRNTVTVINNKGISQSWPNEGIWYTNEEGGKWSREDIGAHEGGHLLGRKDGYLWYRDQGGFKRAPRDEQGNPVPRKGYDKNNVMVKPSGKPSDADIQAIIHGDGHGASGESPSGGSAGSSGPTAAEVDAAHQATGVPSLGAESINHVRGRL